MSRRIVIVQGHPDPAPDRYCRALADAYAEGAAAGGHEVRRIDVATLDFPLLRSQADWETGPAPPAIRACQETVAWAEHIVFVFPLWMGSMPALLRAFLEQLLRPGFAVEGAAGGLRWQKRLAGRSARLVVTMGMPALVYRWYFCGHGLRSLKRNILAFTGIGPVRESLIGMVGAADGARRRGWLEKMRSFGSGGR